MLKRRNIGKWLILILFICFLSSSFASADDNESNGFESNDIPDSIKEFANDPSFIAYRGTLPETIDQEWENSISDCWLDLSRMGPSYSEFDSSLKSVASNNKAIIIELGSTYKEEVDNSRIDEIYQKIDDYCERQEGISEIPVVFMWAHDEENLPLPDYGPQIFEEVKNEPDFIATRGTMPVITNSSEKVEWEEKAGKCIDSFRDELQSYMLENGGPLVGFGYDYRGYIFVEFDKMSPTSVNDSMIDEIYLIIETHCEQEGVSEVPVVFEWGEVPIVDEAVGEPDVDEEMVTLTDKDGNYIDVDKENTSIDKGGNATILDNKTRQKNNENSNQAPGFTSMMVILGFLLLFITKRST